MEARVFTATKTVVFSLIFLCRLKWNSFVKRHLSIDEDISSINTYDSSDSDITGGR